MDSVRSKNVPVKSLLKCMNTFALLVQALIGKQYQCVIRYISYALQTLLKTNKSQCCPDFYTSPDGIDISMLWQFIDWAPQHTH